jgi:glycosyltransferase involved in cell wall biosynthesis
VFQPDVELLRLSLASVQDQTHKNLEIFLVDDGNGSIDQMSIQRIVADYPNARVLRVENNSGPYVGRNLAISKANGKFIAIQDADDWSHPERFAAQLRIFDQSPQAMLVTTEHIRVDQTGNIQLEAGFRAFGDGPMSSMFRRSIFDDLGLFAQVRSRGDIEMRERIRGYYGHQAISELPVPMMLCFAGSETLSQQVKARKYEALKLFRTSFDLRPSMSNLRRSDGNIRLDKELVIPHDIRPDVAI